MAKREHDLHAIAQDKLGLLSDAVTQSLNTIRLQRATRSEALWQRRLHKEAREYSESRFAVVKTGWKIFPLAALPTLFAYAVLLFWGVQLVRRGQLTVGQFVALQSYVLMLQGPLGDMGDCIAEWQRGFASFSRIVEIFNLQSLADLWQGKTRIPERSDGSIEINQLSYSYGILSRSVLQKIDMFIAPGQHVGICGPVGAGKSTLLSLLAGLTEAPAGVIKIAGVDVHDLDRGWLAQNVAMVPQRAFLFAGTIRYNLELDDQFTDDQLWDVLKLVHLADDVRGFSDSLETWIGEWGINLSGGQKQRLALARTLLRQRPILLLDDCLSAVDAVTEEEILKGLRSRLGQATVIWVAHRMSTLKLCQSVYRLDKGVLLPLSTDDHQAGEREFRGG